MKKAKVLFEYEPQEDDELTLRVGDIISEVEPADIGWCSGLLKGKRGVFPDNFVEMFEEEEEKKPPTPAAHKKPNKKKVRKMKVNFPYNAENSDEISLEAGDIIEIIQDVEDGWAEGINRGKKGVFPTNFGEIIEESDDAADGVADGKPEELENKHNEEIAPPTQKKVKGIGFGDIFGGGPIKLRQKSMDSDKPKNLTTAPPTKALTPSKEKDIVKDMSTPKAKSTIPAKQKDISAGKPKKTLNYCKVMFDYTQDNSDELTLVKGEVVIILDKNLEDDGWWEGEKILENGKRVKGVFPDNFVIELTPDEAREYERQQQAKLEPEPVKESKALKPTKDAKKVSPLMPTPPSQTSKPTLNSDITNSDSTYSEISFVAPSTTDHTLAQIKRPGGPKNRRKPAASERREKAASSVDEAAEEVQSSEEEVKPEKAPEPAKKKESMKRGVAVLPGLGGGGDSTSGETPSWLQNLKNRQSVKKTPPAISPAKDQSEKPAWLTNLKKRQSAETVGQPPQKEKVALQPKTSTTEKKPAVDKPANGPSPPLKPAAPKPTSPSTTDKPLAAWQIERQQKVMKPRTSDSNEEKAPEPPEQPSTPTEPAWKSGLNKKAAVPAKPPAEPPAAPAKKPDKPPIGTPVTTPAAAVKPKPAPPKMKPAPAAKPASSTAVEELKNEVKSMKEEMMKMKEEFKKEFTRLNTELQNEVQNRMSLEDEIRKLRQNISS